MDISYPLYNLWLHPADPLVPTLQRGNLNCRSSGCHRTQERPSCILTLEVSEPARLRLWERGYHKI